MSACQGTKYVSGHKRVWAQTYMFLPRHDCDYTIITCQGTNVSGHKHVWAQSCLGTIVWAQVCMCTIVWSPLLLFIGSAVGVENSALDISKMSIELLGISGGERLGEAEHSEKRRVVEGRFVGEGRFEGEAAPSEKQSGKI